MAATPPAPMNREDLMLNHMLRTALPAATGLMLATAAWAEDPVKIGFITTLSGPAGYLGQDLRDGFALAIEMEGGTLGGKPVELVVEDDGLKPANARQSAERMLEDGVKLFSGVVFANVAGAAVPEILDAGAVYISANTASSDFAGKGCAPNYFVSSWQDDGQGESAGALAQEKGYKSAWLVAPNYQAGQETMVAFKRFFKGEILGEVYTNLDQTDFASELAAIRAANPEVVYEFEPGGLGIAFIKQYQQAGLLGEIPLAVHPASLDQAIVAAVGDAAEGLMVTSHWNSDFDNPVNKAFVEAWQKKFGAERPITYYAAQGYDAALMAAEGLKTADPSDAEVFRAALLAAEIPSVRGPFKFGKNQHPVQDWYVLRAEKNAEGKIDLVTGEKVLTGHGDVYAADCGL